MRDRTAPEGIGSCQALIFLLKHLSQELGFFPRMENRRFLHQEKAILRGLVQPNGSISLSRIYVLLDRITGYA